MKEGPASLWPPGVVTTTGAIWLPVIDPVRGGVITTICALLIEVTCPAAPLKVTEAEEPKLRPWMVTDVPPFHGPVSGVRLALLLFVISGP